MSMERFTIVRVLIAVWFFALAAHSVFAVDLNPGDIVVADEDAAGGNGAIVKVDPVTGVQTTISSGGNFVDPVSVTLESSGKLLVADADGEFSGTGSIIRVDPATGKQTVISSGGSFVDPSDVVVEKTGMLLVVDTNAASFSGAVFRVDPTTGDQTLLSSGGLFVDPRKIVITGDGRILVADSGGGPSPRVIEVDPVTGAQKVAYDGGSIFFPEGIALESNGNVLLADAGANGLGAVIRIDPVTKVQTFATTGSGYFEGGVNSVAVEDDGSILVTDVVSVYSDGALFRANPNTGDATVLCHGGLFSEPRGIAVVPHRSQSVAIDPDGQFVVYATKNKSCAEGLLLFQPLTSDGNPAGEVVPLIGCDSISYGVTGLDILKKDGLYWISFGGLAVSDSKFLMAIDAVGNVIHPPTSVVPSSAFLRPSAATAIAANATGNLNLWSIGKKNAIYRAVIDLNSLTLLATKKSSAVAQTNNALQATQSNSAKQFLATRVKNQILKGFVLKSNGIPDGSSFRLSPRTDGGHTTGGVSADGLMAVSNDSDPPSSQIYIQPLGSNGLPVGNPRLVVNSAEPVDSTDITNPLVGGIRFVVYRTDTYGLYLRKINATTVEKIGGIIVLSTN